MNTLLAAEDAGEDSSDNDAFETKLAALLTWYNHDGRTPGQDLDPEWRQSAKPFKSDMGLQGSGGMNLHYGSNDSSLTLFPTSAGEAAATLQQPNSGLPDDLEDRTACDFSLFFEYQSDEEADSTCLPNGHVPLGERTLQNDMMPSRWTHELPEARFASPGSESAWESLAGDGQPTFHARYDNRIPSTEYGDSTTGAVPIFGLSLGGPSGGHAHSFGNTPSQCLVAPLRDGDAEKTAEMLSSSPLSTKISVLGEGQVTILYRYPRKYNPQSGTYQYTGEQTLHVLEQLSPMETTAMFSQKHKSRNLQSWSLEERSLPLACWFIPQNTSITDFTKHLRTNVMNGIWKSLLHGERDKNDYLYLYHRGLDKSRERIDTAIGDAVAACTSHFDAYIDQSLDKTSRDMIFRAGALLRGPRPRISAAPALPYFDALNPLNGDTLFSCRNDRTDEKSSLVFTELRVPKPSPCNGRSHMEQQAGLVRGNTNGGSSMTPRCRQ